MYNSNRVVQVYHEDVRVGEMEIHLPPPREDDVMKKERVMEQVKMGIIRLSRFSQPSQRCTPLSVLTTISSSGLCFTLEASASATPAHDPLTFFHSSCLRDNKVYYTLWWNI